MKIIEPEIGCWYKNGLDKTEFEVVAFDDDDGTIEIQFTDGEIEELEIEYWYSLQLNYIATPDCWSGLYDDSETDLEREIIVKPDNWGLLDELRIDDGEIDVDLLSENDDI